ncbi:MAG: hypothetical protein K9K64_05225 [Desulfohalobiaceae bacterium]|nr:hypothetical protein [Desulfohalobiaceae bacterium]
MKNPYPNEKFSQAIETMATSPKPIQDRIADAYLNHIDYVNPEDVPEEVRYQFHVVNEKMTKVDPVGNEGSVVASARQLTDNEAVELANKIVLIADAVRSDYFNE